MAKDNKPSSAPRFSSPSASKPSSPSAQRPKPTPATEPQQTPSSPSAAQEQPPNEQTASSSAPADSNAAAEEKEPQIPLSQLPDLTQGIPSTLEYETTGATNKQSLAPVEEEEGAAASGGGRGRGELPASAYISSTERRRQKWANWMFGGTAALLVAGTVYLGRDWDDDEELNRHPDVPNGWGLGLWWNRASTRMKEVMTYYHEPAFEKLLPDPDPMFERPYTLCISLEDLLVHSEWSREHGWRVAKRPGVDYFLHYLSQYYELVLFTTVPFAIAEPLVRKLDPFRFIVWPLYREATKYKDGEIIKVCFPLLALPCVFFESPSHG